jgi:lysozyme family protein
MTPAFLRALAKTLEHEGGYSNHPLDRGGATNQGITQKTYDAYRRGKGLEPRSVLLIEDHEVSDIYYTHYWQPAGCESLEPKLAAAVFDMAVHSGPWNAKLALQRAVRVRADGVIGPVTVEATRKTPAVRLKFLKQRGAFIQEIVMLRPSQVAFLEGWINRLLEQAYDC